MPSTVYSTAKVFLVIEGRTIPVWKKFLSAQENIQALINFFGTYLLRIARNNPFVQPGHTLYGAVIFGNLRVVKVFSEQIVTDFPELYSSQEEADTRMMLQALHADKNLQEIGKKDQIIIKTFDTDVIVLCIDFFPRMTNTTELWVQMRNVRNVKNGRRFFPIYHLCASL